VLVVVVVAEVSGVVVSWFVATWVALAEVVVWGAVVVELVVEVVATGVAVVSDKVVVEFEVVEVVVSGLLLTEVVVGGSLIPLPESAPAVVELEVDSFLWLSLFWPSVASGVLEVAAVDGGFSLYLLAEVEVLAVVGVETGGEEEEVSALLTEAASGAVEVAASLVSTSLVSASGVEAVSCSASAAFWEVSIAMVVLIFSRVAVVDSSARAAGLVLVSNLSEAAAIVGRVSWELLDQKWF